MREQLKSAADVVRNAFVDCVATGRALRGATSAHGIRAGYRHRETPSYFDDTGLADGWQREVYRCAARLMREQDLRSVHDVGCGSGYKLVHYLGEYETTGFDVEQTVGFLRRKYPDRSWRAESFATRGLPPADLVVCADVIEHVPDPQELLGFVEALAKRWIILSTPARELLYRPGSLYLLGPPKNATHLREWSFAEFGRYIGKRFEVVHHEVTNVRQATQMVLCRRRDPVA